MNVIRGKLDYIDRKEALRYAGYLGIAACEAGKESSALFDECEKIMLETLSPAAVYSPFPLSRGEGAHLNLGFAEVESKSLQRNLVGCNKIVLFAATLGIGPDRLIAKYNRISPARAAVMQALGAAAAEQWCDMVNECITRQYGSSRPRFSCGYGDLPLKLQREIFPALQVTKNIGVTLTDGDLMMPEKSVTAIVGILGDN
ncbi:MAG TPA: Vitamin B12 dependent methionine synthase activation subunit [Candidatus Coproplasma excrementavium]|nr:Vitamin B12 dependent methionine synthase activation subunit [Candidatus Coproplasma excrementavium]